VRTPAPPGCIPSPPARARRRSSSWRTVSPVRAAIGWVRSRSASPGRAWPHWYCPWLVCVGEADRVARPGPAIAAARRAPFGELRTYAGVDHFDIYDGPQHEAVVADEIAFLRRHLLAQ